MKAKLLKKLRNKAEERIGVFFCEGQNSYSIVFDKRVLGDVSDWAPKNNIDDSYQVIKSGIFDKNEAINECDRYRRIFILDEARRYWGKSKYGNKERIY